MKRRLAILAVLLLCLSACASGKQFDPTKCQTLLQMEPAVQAAVLSCVQQ